IRSDKNRTYHRQNLLYEKLKLKEKEVMSFLHNLEMENIEARENNQELQEGDKCLSVSETSRELGLPTAQE
ncbi:mCG125816, partial [Mus musculus]